jgi:hypothetical protein
MPLPVVLYITTTTTTTNTNTNTNTTTTNNNNNYYHQAVNVVNRLIIPGDFMFSQWCCWEFGPFGIWRRVFGLVVPDVAKDHSGSTFRSKHFKKNEACLEYWNTWLPLYEGITALYNFGYNYPDDAASQSRRLESRMEIPVSVTNGFNSTLLTSARWRGS